MLWVVLLAAVVLVAAYQPYGGLANALGTASPTGSPTGTVLATSSASPTPPNQPSPIEPAIQLVNPSKYQSDVKISSKKDEDETYHLVAWVANAPSDATVEFQLSQAPECDETTLCEHLGTATLVGPDTYEFEWDTASRQAMTDGTLHAILASGETQVKDTETIDIDNTKETIEITAPANGDPLPIYDPPGASVPGFVVETTTSSVVTTGTSAGTKTPRVVYSTSAPGSEPSWKNCFEQHTLLYSDNPQGRQRIGCILRTNDKAADVTLIAAVARVQAPNDTLGQNGCMSTSCTGAQSDHAGDAHRVAPYLQVPTGIEIIPEASAATANECAIRSAILKDQSDRSIWRGQVDLHATGPSDQLQFAKHAQSSPFQRPDSGHSRLEPAGLCSGQSGTPRQADHEVVGGLDGKHIESTAAGTGIEGGFTYALKSPDAEGKTVELAWADKDGDDVFDCEEPSDWGKITWSQPPTPVAVATTAPTEGVPACGEPTPTPTETAAATPTSTTTTSPTGTTTSQPSASSTTPLLSEQALSLASERSKVTAGRTVALTGQLSSEDPTCRSSGVEVTIGRRVYGTSRIRELARVSTDVGGNFIFEAKVKRSADYIATAPAHDDCAAATSGPVSVLARTKVAAHPTESAVPFGSTLNVKGRIAPKHPGTRVLLQRKKAKKWVVVDKGRTNLRSRFTLRTRASWFGSRTFRVKWPSSDRDHITSFSKRFKVASA